MGKNRTLTCIMIPNLLRFFSKFPVDLMCKREKPIGISHLHTRLMSNIRFLTFRYKFDKILYKFGIITLSMFAAIRQRSIFSINFNTR